ncbi:MAG: glycosyltransferase family 2 protein [Burkholderiales bacterium]
MTSPIYRRERTEHWNVMTAPRFSVVLPTHNRPKFLAEAVASIAVQTMRDLEVIVVDDDSVPPAQPNDAGISIRLIRHAQAQGGAASKNTGASAARGELIAFLDDDDLYAPTYLERAAKALDNNPDIDIVFMGVDWFGSRAEYGRDAYERGMTTVRAIAGGSTAADGTILFEQSKLLEALLRLIPMAFQRPVMRRAAYERVGAYRKKSLLWDCDWALRAMMVCSAGLVLDPLYRQRVDGQGVSSQPARTLDHIRSNSEMKQRLLNSNQDSPSAALIRRAAAQAWFDLAYHQAQQRETIEAWHAWINSFRLRQSMAHFRLAARIVLNSVTARPR